MNSVTGKILLALVLVAGMGSAFARPNGGEWAAHRDARMQRHGGQQGNPNEGRRFEQPQHAPAFVPAEEPRRGGRMSPEERRALRRQIDEAGRDLYAPRR